MKKKSWKIKQKDKCKTKLKDKQQEKHGSKKKWNGIKRKEDGQRKM